MSINPLAGFVEELQSFEDKYKECLKAIQDFCADCPLEGNAVECSSCYLMEV